MLHKCNKRNNIPIMERTDSDRCKSILRIFNQLVAIRSRGDEARWKAMSYADHRTPTDTRSSDCPVEKLNLYDCTGVMAIRTLVESLGGSVMSPNQDWFSLRISPRSYRHLSESSTRHMQRRRLPTSSIIPTSMISSRLRSTIP